MCAPMASKSRDRAKERPSRVILPLALSIEMMSPAAACATNVELLRLMVLLSAASPALVLLMAA